MKKLTLVLIIFFTAQIMAKDIGFIGSYGGLINNVQKSSANAPEKDETQFMIGLYTQYINSEYFQVNDFFYYIPEVNDTKIIGNHLNADYYPYHFSIGRAVIGAGLEYLIIDIDESNTELKQTVTVPYGRVGQYFKFGGDSEISILPWTGYGVENFTGEGSITFTVPGNPTPMSQDIKIDEKEQIALFGCNVQYMYERYFSIKLKYTLTHKMDSKDNYSKVVTMVNSYIHRHIGISYRFTYDEQSNGEDLYNLLGIFYIF